MLTKRAKNNDSPYKTHLLLTHLNNHTMQMHANASRTKKKKEKKKKNPPHPLIKKKENIKRKKIYIFRFAKIFQKKHKLRHNNINMNAYK